MSAPTPFPTDLDGMCQFLRRQQWDFKFVSRTLPDGTQRYSANVWRSDALGGGHKCVALTAPLALQAALLSARKCRHRRQQRQAKRLKGAAA